MQKVLTFFISDWNLHKKNNIFITYHIKIEMNFEEQDFFVNFGKIIFEIGWIISKLWLIEVANLLFATAHYDVIQGITLQVYIFAWNSSVFITSFG